MKNIVRYIIPMAGLAAFVPLVVAQDAPPPDKKEMRVVAGPGAPDDNAPPSPHGHRMSMHDRGPREMESVTFLGVATGPAGATLADQLDLPKDTGLVVTMIAPDGPAANVLKKHDVLVKLDDQLLVEQRQLSVLVRNHKEGDEVTLTYIRLGKQETAKVKLGKHDIPKMAQLELDHPLNMAFAFGGADGESHPGMGREDADRVLSLIGRGEGQDGPGEPTFNVQIQHDGGPGMRNITVNTSNSNMVFSDTEGSLDLTIKDGKKTLVAKNAKGEQLYSGPVNTPEERKALPADVRTRLDKLESMQEFSFRTDGDFKPGETKDARVLHQGIALPQPPPPSDGRPVF